MAKHSLDRAVCLPLLAGAIVAYGGTSTLLTVGKRTNPVRHRDLHCDRSGYNQALRSYTFQRRTRHETAGTDTDIMWHKTVEHSGGETR
jgi:hypothetical protein